jgi:ankyrin repeat protein
MAFLQACKSGDRGVVAAMLSEGYDPTVDVSTFGQYGLTEAAKRNHVDVMRMLMDRSTVDVNRSDGTLDTALLSSIQFNHFEAFQLLLEHPSIDVNQLAFKGMHCALTLSATSKASTKFLCALLRRSDTNVNARNRYGQTALMMAVASENAAAVTCLVEHPATDVCCVDNRNQTALLCLESDNPTIAASIIADRRHHLHGVKEVQHFVSRRQASVAALLLQCLRSEVNMIGETGFTTLALACHVGCLPIVQSLLHHKHIDIKSRNRDQSTALIVACKQANVLIIETMLSRADTEIDAREVNGNTALQFAARSGHTSIVVQLVASMYNKMYK